MSAELSLSYWYFNKMKTQHLYEQSLYLKSITIFPSYEGQQKENTKEFYKNSKKYNDTLQDDEQTMESTPNLKKRKIKKRLIFLCISKVTSWFTLSILSIIQIYI